MSHKTHKERQDEATERNAAWAALPWQTQLERLHRRPGFSKRQRDRIMAPLTDKKRQILAARNTEAVS